MSDNNYVPTSRRQLSPWMSAIRAVPKASAAWWISGIGACLLAACAADGGDTRSGAGLGVRLTDTPPASAATLDARAYSRYISLGDSFSSGIGTATQLGLLCGRTADA